MNYPDVKSIIDSVISDHIRYEYPKLVEFAKAYFDFLEQSNKAGFYQNNLPQQRDVELQEAQFAARIQKELGIVAPQEYAADPKIFFNKIKEIWNAKGSEESIKAFFRLYLNDEVDIFYPWESVLIPSDGRWLVKTVLRVTMIDGTPDQFVGQRIRQLNGDATAIVDAYETRIYSDSIIYELNLVKDSISDSFDPQSVIYVEGISGLRAEVYRTFSGFNIVNGGTRYSIGDKIVATGLDGYTFTSYVSVVDNTGKVADIKVTNFGAGNTPLHVRESNVSETYYFDDYVINSYDLSEFVIAAAIDSEYNNGAISNITSYQGSDFFKREVTVNGVRIVAAGTVGGQIAVPDAWLEKVARMFELFLDKDAAGINETAQRNVIKTLRGDAGTYHAAAGPTLQRVARGAGSDYTPNFLTDEGIASWNLSPLFDTHVANDMVWYLNSTGDGYGIGEIDAQEVIEHVFHTLHMHGLDAVSLKMYPYISADWATGPLYAAMVEAYDGGFWDPAGYGGAAFKTDGDAFEVAAKEYLYLLNFSMFEYTGLWDGDSLAPEWADTVRTAPQIQTNLPLGYALFNTYIAPVIGKPSLATINSIFGDGNTPAQDNPALAGASGYVINTGTTGWVNSGGQLQLTRATVSGLVDGQVGYVTLANVEIPLRILSITAAGSNSIYVFDYLASTAQLAELNAGYSINFTSQVSNPNPELTITSNGGTGLELTFNFTGQVNYPGFYEGVKGQLSEGIVLQDSFYYQKFSYEIKTTQSSDKWINALKRTIHPGGTEVFGNITLTELLDSTIKSSEMFVLKLNPNGYLFVENPGLKSSALLFGETPADAYVLITDHYFAEDYVGGASFRSVYSGLYTDSTASITETPNDISSLEFV
jgi:hypothetical protein